MISYISKNTEKVCLFIYIIINSLFAFKYSPYPYTSVLIYTLFIIIGYILYCRYKDNIKAIKHLAPVLAIAIISVSIVLFCIIDPYNVIVDRWSALYFWSEKLFDGKYPYSAQTHLDGGYGSPFPVWQILHSPFYLLGEMGVSHILMIILLFYFLRKYIPSTDLVLFFLLLALSPAYWWEVAVRSDLMNNLFLCLLFVSIFHFRFKQTNKLFILGIIIGLILCSRLLLGIPLFIYFFPYFLSKNNIGKIKIIVGCIIGFILPFIPLMIMNWNMLFYFEFSPLVLQTRQATPNIVGVGVILLALFSFLWKNDFKKYLFCISCVVFVFIFTAFIKYGITYGIDVTIIDDIFDISYFGTVLPFVIAALSFKNINNENIHILNKQ